MNINQILDRMSLEEKIEQLHGCSFYDCTDNERLGIEGIHVCDGPHGVRSESGGGPSTCFPVGIALTATWEPEVVQRVGRAMGLEFLGYGKNTVLGPSCDIKRDPRNGRSPESGGEDPFLSGKINAAQARGIQSAGAIATVKHFAANNHQANRANDNHSMDERTLREFYGLPFRIVVQEAEVLSVMCAYNWINGVPCSENYDLLTRMLRNEWGFKYFVMSDWWATYTNAANSINAGLDLEMPEGQKYPLGLKQAVESGEVSREVLDRAVSRVLAVKEKIGFPRLTNREQYQEYINCPEHRALNLEAGLKSIVLLKNEDNILPLNKQIKSIALIGPNADRLVLDGFGSSEVVPHYVVTPRQGIAQAAPDVRLTYAEGCHINSSDTSGFEAAIKAAQEAEYVVFVGGLDKSQEGEGYDERAGKDRENASVQLPGKQQELINQLAWFNPNLIVVLQSGGICSVTRCLGNIKGLIYAWYCGNEGGNAIARVLFGDFNPGGKLPVTMAASDDQLPAWNNLDFTDDGIHGVGYRRFDAHNMQPLFAFGHGLSYTAFTYSNLQISGEGPGKSPVTVTVDVTNSGKRTGDEVVQLYLSHTQRAVPMPEKQLKGFGRVNLNPGETKTVTMVLTPYELSYWDTNRRCYFVEKGAYTVRVGGSSDRLVLSKTFTVSDDYAIPYGRDELSIGLLTPKGRSLVKDTLTIRWHTNNPGNIPLTYTVELWNGKKWLLLAEGVTGEEYAWNTGKCPDGTYRLRVRAKNTLEGTYPETAVSGVFTLRNRTETDINLSRNKPVTVSTVKSRAFAGENAVDADPGTCWASDESGRQQWLLIDLERYCDLHRVALSWGTDYAAFYEIKVSPDNNRWTSISTVTKGQGGSVNLDVLALNVRYVRLHCNTGVNSHRFSLHSIDLFGTESAKKYTLKTSVTGSGSVQTVGAVYEAGTEASLVALPAQGWLFSHWEGDHEGSEASLALVMDGDKSVTACFVRLT